MNPWNIIGWIILAAIVGVLFFVTIAMGAT